MIFDSIHRKECYRQMPLVYAALCALQRAGEGPFPNVPVLSGLEGVRINPVSFTTKPAAECRFEAHRAYIDIHYLVAGTEGIATADAGALTPLGDYDEAQDIQFFTGQQDGLVFLKPGQFMLCFAHDAHKVCIMDGLPAPTQKLVAKLPMAQFCAK